MSFQLGMFSKFDDSSRPKSVSVPPESGRFKAALVFGAIGDALGWPTEFLRRSQHSGQIRNPRLPTDGFVAWNKRIGGRWWGYDDTIEAGQYSDDTQLTLAVARCISELGEFEVQSLAYEELPLWLHYERGGGRSVKTAARSLLKPKVTWHSNFYKTKQLSYLNSGANGAAMRCSPIALVQFANYDSLVRDTVHNTLVTHGHPRAFIGSLLFAQAVAHIMSSSTSQLNGALADYLAESLPTADDLHTASAIFPSWARTWNDHSRDERMTFESVYNDARDEAIRYLSLSRQMSSSSINEYYEVIGAFSPSTKESGVATTCAAIHLFDQLSSHPDIAIFTAATMTGSDTDTVGAFLGTLLGAYHGLPGIPDRLYASVQDRGYLESVGGRLHGIAIGIATDNIEVHDTKKRDEILLKLLAWEIGLHEMFWDALDAGSLVVHPTLGRGTIDSKSVHPIRREGYVAKRFRIRFDCGQTCMFRSLVRDNNEVAESLAQDIHDALDSDADRVSGV